MEVGELTVVAGAGGARNITIDWIAVPVGNDLPCRFNVKTLAGHGLEVVVEQLAYKRDYVGTGAVSTQVIPVAPTGTMGNIVVRDTTTGERAETPWKWRRLGSSSPFSRALHAIKRLIWK